MKIYNIIARLLCHIITNIKGGVGDKPMTKYKIICVGKDEKVIGLHCIGMASDEVIQGFGMLVYIYQYV